MINVSIEHVDENNRDLVIKISQPDKVTATCRHKLSNERLHLVLDQWVDEAKMYFELLNQSIQV
jgi:hypothetical protein|tara:strand:+ start:1137 stop:1328 length:192 start_codon:yes stop_codon:yes gene_type:complete